MTEYESGMAFGWFDIMVLGLGLFALIYLLLDPLIAELLATGETHLTTDDAIEGHALVTDAWAWAPAFVLMLAGFALLARSVFESRMVGR